MSARPRLLWVDLTVSVRHAELPAALTESCDIEPCQNPADVPARIESGRYHGIVFDFDYPDQHSLETVCNIKDRFPSLPAILVTLQHSEALAVWAFRSRLIDFLVKPVSRTEVHRSLQVLRSVDRYRAGQRNRRSACPRAPFPPEIPRTVQPDDVRLLPALYHVQHRYRYKIRNEDVAKLCAMSPFRFSRSFHETYGITFQDYVVRYRILQACRLLENPGMSITDVAYAVGFNDGSYFSRTFRRCIGQSPSAFSQQHRGDSIASSDEVALCRRLNIPEVLQLARA